MGQSERLRNNSDALLAYHLNTTRALNRVRESEQVLRRAAYEATETVPQRVKRWLHMKRRWWRYRYIAGAPYPPRTDAYTREKYSWWRDFKVVFKNPPQARRRQIL